MRRLAAAALRLGALGARAEVSVPLALEKGIPVATLTIGGTPFPFKFDIGPGRMLHLTPEVVAKIRWRRFDGEIRGLKRTGRQVKRSGLAARLGTTILGTGTVPD